MKIIVKLVASILLLSLYACQPEGRVFSDHQKISGDLEWFKSDVIKLNIPIDSVGKSYDLGITFRFATGFPYQVAKIKLTETSPSGVVTEKLYELKLREENGSYIGDGSGDIWDSEHTVEPNKTFSEKGVYKYEIEHVMPKDPVLMVMDIGMVLDEVK